MEGKYIILKTETKYMSCMETYIQFKNYLYKAIRSFQGEFEFDDLFQIACVGFIKAYKAYDSNNNVLFLTFLAKVVNNDLYMLCRKQKKHMKNTSMETETKVDPNGNILTIEDFISDNTNYEDIAINNIIAKNITGKIDSLPNKQKLVIKGLYFQGKTEKQLINIVHSTQGNISRLKKKGIKNLRLMGGIYD